MADKPRHYPQEFKDEAVALVQSSDRPVAEVARSLGVSDRTLWNWVNNARKRHARANDPTALSEEELADSATAQGDRPAADRHGDPSKGGRLFRQRDDAVTGYRFVHDHRAEYSVMDLCRVAQVCRSSYYAWANRTPSAREVDNEILLKDIRAIHQLPRHLRRATGLGATTPPGPACRASPGGPPDGPRRPRGCARAKEVATGTPRDGLRPGPAQSGLLGESTGRALGG